MFVCSLREGVHVVLSWVKKERLNCLQDKEISIQLFPIWWNLITYYLEEPCATCAQGWAKINIA